MHCGIELRNGKQSRLFLGKCLVQCAWRKIHSCRRGTLLLTELINYGASVDFAN